MKYRYSITYRIDHFWTRLWFGFIPSDQLTDFTGSACRGSTLQGGLMITHREGKSCVRCTCNPMESLQPLLILFLHWCYLVQRLKQYLLAMKALGCDISHNKVRNLALILDNQTHTAVHFKEERYLLLLFKT